MRFVALLFAPASLAGCAIPFTGVQVGDVQLVLLQDTFTVQLHDGHRISAALGPHCWGGSFDESTREAKAFAKDAAFPGWRVVREWRDPSKGGNPGWVTTGARLLAAPVPHASTVYDAHRVAGGGILVRLEFHQDSVDVAGHAWDEGGSWTAEAHYEVSEPRANATVHESVLVRYVGTASLRLEEPSGACM